MLQPIRRRNCRRKLKWSGPVSLSLSWRRTAWPKKKVLLYNCDILEMMSYIFFFWAITIFFSFFRNLSLFWWPSLRHLRFPANQLPGYLSFPDGWKRGRIGTRLWNLGHEPFPFLWRKILLRGTSGCGVWRLQREHQTNVVVLKWSCGSFCEFLIIFTFIC